MEEYPPKISEEFLDGCTPDFMTGLRYARNVLGLIGIDYSAAQSELSAIYALIEAELSELSQKRIKDARQAR